MDPARPEASSGEIAAHAILPQTLRLRDAVAVVVGSMIGSGIFMKEPTIAGQVGAFGPILGIWLAVGILTWCGALAIGELAAMMPQAGGPYVYLREAYGRLPAFLWGWTEFWIIRTASIGSLACATVIYLEALMIRTGESASGLSHSQQALIACGVVLLLAAVNARGARWGAVVQNSTTLIKTGFLGMLIVMPWVLGRADPAHLAPLAPDNVGIDFWRSVGLAMIAVKWPYDGWVNVGFIAEEIERPQRNVPLALSLGLGAIVLLYLLTTISYHLVLPFNEVVGSKRIAADVSQSLFGPAGATLAAVGVMISTLGACNSNMLTGPRIYFALARDGLLPRAVSALHPTYRTPANAIWLQTVWAVVLVVAAFAWKSGPGDSVADAFDELTDFVIFGGEMFYAMTVAAVFVLRGKYPDRARPYRTWGYPFTPLIYLAGFAAVLTSLLMNKPVQTVAGSVLILAGVGWYYAVKLSTGRQGQPLGNED
ncbi:MAG: amino acid permease [Planctomyces sp.]|nr:amino acid permease [Planctomyces sp.]